MQDRVELRRWLGVEPPEGLLACLGALGAWARGSEQRLEDALDEAFGVAFAEGNHADLPAEVFPWLQGGEHAHRFGYVVWAPELPGSDHPVVRIDGTGRLHPYAPDTPSTFRRLVGEKLSWDPEYDVHMGQEVFRAMGLPETEHLLTELSPRVPVGWKHAPTRDGVGVLAPAAAFEEGVRADPSLSLAEHQAWVGRLLYHRKAGSALVVLKDACHVGRRRPGVHRALGGLLAEAYLELGRAPSAQVARRRTALQP